MLYTPLNVDKLGAYLHHRYPERTNLRIAKAQRSYPGMSRETWMVTLEWDEGTACASEKLVVRLDPVGGIPQRPLRNESEIYRRLFHTNVPVPELIWHEDDAQWLLEGRDFSVRKWSAGTLEPPHLHDTDPAHDATRIEAVQELLRKLADIHALDWHALGFDQIMPVPRSPDSCAREALDDLLAALDEHAMQPLPGLYDALYWFRDHPPAPPKKICLRKENNGIGEEVWDGTKIVAMCDWETASLGDPALDLAIAFGTTVKYWDEQQALDYYNAISGNAISLESVRWYQQFWRFKAAVWLQLKLRNFVTGRDRRVQLAVLGGPFVYTAQKAVRDIVRAANP